MCGLLGCNAIWICRWVRANISEEHIASIFKVYTSVLKEHPVSIFVGKLAQVHTASQSRSWTSKSSMSWESQMCWILRHDCRLRTTRFSGKMSVLGVPMRDEMWDVLFLKTFLLVIWLSLRTSGVLLWIVGYFKHETFLDELNDLAFEEGFFWSMELRWFVLEHSGCWNSSVLC